MMDGRRHGPAPRRNSEDASIDRSVLVVTAAVAAAACASTSFNSTWRNPAAEPGNFQGQKVAALVMSTDQSVRFGAEDALARELTARGAVGIAAYSLIPKELTQDKEKAKEFLEKATWWASWS